MRERLPSLPNQSGSSDWNKSSIPSKSNRSSITGRGIRNSFPDLSTCSVETRRKEALDDSVATRNIYAAQSGAKKIQRSSVVERSAVNRLVVGSSPTAGANFKTAYCEQFLHWQAAV